MSSNTPKHTLFKSFLFAFKGVALILKERNFIIHLIAAITAVALGFIFTISINEWLAIIICISMVLCLEIINTSIEKTIDLLHPQMHPKAGAIKDLAAAAVLIAAITAVIVGLIIFVPKIFGG